MIFFFNVKAKVRMYISYIALQRFLQNTAFPFIPLYIQGKRKFRRLFVSFIRIANISVHLWLVGDFVVKSKAEPRATLHG